MSRSDDLRAALGILGAEPRPEPGEEERTELSWVLHLANGLSGTAEREIFEAELEAGRSGLDVGMRDAAERDMDHAAGWTDEVDDGIMPTVLHWRAGRLHRALGRAMPANADTADPLLWAARDAAALTVALLGYRVAAELQLEDEEHAEFWRGKPEAERDMAIALIIRLTETMRKLTT
jgi:hypothetical protein